MRRWRRLLRDCPPAADDLAEKAEQDDLLDRLRLLSQTTARRAGVEQIELVGDPPDALREIIVNTFVRRDWEASGLAVRIPQARPT